MNAKTNKPIATIFVNPDSKSTKLLEQFLVKNIDRINEYIYINRIKVTPKNVAAVKRKGIEQTPTLLFNNRKYVNLERIIKLLNPPAENKDHFGLGNANPDEMVYQYQSGILDTGDENGEDLELDPETRSNVLRQKMAAMQKRRPQMDGVENSRKLKGGKKVIARQPIKSKFNDDEEFRRAARIDNISETPSKRYMDEQDGEMILEDYYLNEALQSGKKVGNVVSRR